MFVDGGLGAQDMLVVVVLTIFPAAMVFAAVFDLLTYRIPNMLVLALVGAFGVAAFAAQMSLGDVAAHAGVGFAVLLFGLLAFARGWMGAGDAKLLAVSALWFGPSQVLAYIGLGAILGGGLTLAILTLRQMPLPPRLERLPWLARLANAGEGVPYGLALGPAALILFSASPWIAVMGGGSFSAL